MRRFWLVAPIALLLACARVPDVPPGTVSCQPYGNTPAPIVFTFAPGPVTSEAAVRTAEALVRSCQFAGTPIVEIISTSRSDTGHAGGPNAGRMVWAVEITATVDVGAAGLSLHHFWIEVDQATGVPVMMGLG